MDNSKIDPNIKLILDLRNNKGVFPISSESAIIAHSPSGEMTYLDSVIDYLYQQVANKLRLYTELDGNNTRGKAYPATMGIKNSANITSLLNIVNNHASLLRILQEQVDDMDPSDDITSMNTIINQLREEFNNLMEASEYSYLEIKFSNYTSMPSNDLDNSLYWKDSIISNSECLWLGVRKITITRGVHGEAIITKGNATIVSLQGPRGEQGPPGPRGATGSSGESYKTVFMYKWTDSRTTVPDTPTNPLNEGWLEDPGIYTGNAKYLWMTLNLKRMSTNTYIGSWSTPVCLSGEDGTNASLGLMGPVVRFRGEYTPNTEYINSSLDENLSSTAIRYIDVVMVTSGLTKTYYMVKPSTDPNDGIRRTYVSPTTSGLEDWEEAAGFSFIAAEALYAQNAHIDNLSGYEFVVQDDNNHIVAGMTGGNVENSVVAMNSSTPVRIWAGSNATGDINLLSNTIPFKVFQNGKLKATDAEIKGDLQVDSLSLTGNRGSYYYNELEITLPEANEYKHTVIFIITSDTATEVSAAPSNVLFALSNNSMTTINSTGSIKLEKYKIYLAISIQDGINIGWLILNLNSLETTDNTGYFERDIITLRSIFTDLCDDPLGFLPPSITLNRNQIIGKYITPELSYESWTNPNNIEYNFEGAISIWQGSDTLTTIHFNRRGVTTIGSLTLANLAEGTEGNITIEDLFNIYNGNESNDIWVTTPSGTNLPTAIFDITTKDLKILWNDFIDTIDWNLNFEVVINIKLIHSFNYTLPQNSPSPVTTTTVGSNGLVINKGSIVATDMPAGAVVNAKDCIVYKDVTVDPDNEEYEVTNYGNLGVSIGNYTLNPKNSILVKAATNAHIDFSDITAIDSGDIFDTDPLTPAGEFNE